MRSGVLIGSGIAGHVQVWAKVTAMSADEARVGRLVERLDGIIRIEALRDEYFDEYDSMVTRRAGGAALPVAEQRSSPPTWLSPCAAWA